MAKGGEGMLEATSSSDRECDIVSSSGRTAPVCKHFGFEQKNPKGKSSKALCKLCGKSVTHAGGTSNLKSHLYTWLKSEHDSLFAAPRLKEQPMVTDFMRPTRVEKVAVNSNRAKKLTTTVAEFIARPISVVDGTGFLNLMQIAEPQYIVPCRASRLNPEHVCRL